MTYLDQFLDNLTKEYGSVFFKDKKYYLFGDAFTDQKNIYASNAFDIKGNIYRVIWYILSEYEDNEIRYQELLNQGLKDSDEVDEMYRLETYIEDESNACDWDHPDDIMFDNYSEDSIFHQLIENIFTTGKFMGIKIIKGLK